MQLSKSEKKYRTKIIQEQHLKKINQIWLDKFCKDISYKDFYLSGMQPPPINNLTQAATDIGKQLKRLTKDFICTATEAFSEFSKSISEVRRC